MAVSESQDTLTPSLTCNTVLSPVEEKLWGQLIARRSYFQTIDLYNERYTLGRKGTCDILINSIRIKPEFLTRISKEHFRIERNSSQFPYIQDLSKNGTFINGNLIGQGQRATLCDGDMIAIGWKELEAYQFKDEVNENVNVSRLVDKKYRFVRILGNGSFGVVYLMLEKTTLKKYAIKSIRSDNEKKIMNEVNILDSLNHPFIIHMENIIYDEGYVYIILEYMSGGELQKRVLNENRLPEPIAKLYLYQMANAVNYLHRHGITHRDLKPENVLLATSDLNTLLKITDFGLSKILSESSVMHTICGTPLYVAPEVLQCSQSKSSYTPLVDVWSLGCIMYFMLFGHTPFVVERGDELFARIKSGFYTIPSASDCHEQTVQMIERMLVVDPSERIGINEILSSDWLQNDTKLLRSIADLLQTAN